jgi:hypothetical protein
LFAIYEERYGVGAITEEDVEGIDVVEELGVSRGFEEEAEVCVDAKEGVGVWVGEGDERSEELRREVYCATRVVRSGAREVLSLVGETLREILSEGREVGSESSREVYAEILEVRSGNLDV